MLDTQEVTGSIPVRPTLEPLRERGLLYVGAFCFLECREPGLFEGFHMEIFPGITVDPDVRFGKPCIAGTRIDVSDDRYTFTRVTT